MKGFKDKKKKFHPIGDYKRKKRIPAEKMVEPDVGVKINQSRHNEGLRLKKDTVSNKELEKMFEFKSTITKEQSNREFDEFTNSITDFGSGDIATAVEKFHEVGLNGRELADEVREFSDSTGTPINDIDVVAVAFDFILQNARNKIDEVLDFDIVNDIEDGTEFYVAGNFMATSYDFSEEAVDQLRNELKKASKTQLNELSDDIFVKSFLRDIDIFL